MREIWKTAVLTAALVLALCSCGTYPTIETAAPPPTPTRSPAPLPSETQTPQTSEFGPLPVTEQAIRDYYAAEGYYAVEAVTPYEGDFLVELSDGGDCSLLCWIFGHGGRTVQLNAMDYMTSYRILDRGEVEISNSGVSAMTPWKGLHQTYVAAAPLWGGDYATVTEQATWVDLETPLYIGWWDYVENRPAESERYEQLYDARIDADGLSFSFIPSGDSAEKFQTFFPACTTIPSFQTGFDPDTRRFTLRLYNVCLESGGLTAEDLDWIGTGAYDGLYPYFFPAGPLGRDSHFLTNVEVRADGEDVVVTATATERARTFTVESSDLGYDSIPSFRLIFHGEDPLGCI